MICLALAIGSLALAAMHRAYHDSAELGLGAGPFDGDLEL